MKFWKAETVAGVLFGAGLMVNAASSLAQSKGVSAFLGSYTGQIVFTSARGLEKRDLDVTIQREGRGFSVEWTTVSQLASGKTKSKSYFVAFGPADRTGVHLPIGSIDRFGAKVAVDPLKGRPQLWAEVRGDSLFISAVVQTDRGGLEKQVYERRLIPGGLELNFSRTRDGKPLKSLHVKMKTKDQFVNPR